MELPEDPSPSPHDFEVDDVAAMGAAVLRTLANRYRQRLPPDAASADNTGLVERLEAAAMLVETGHLDRDYRRFHPFVRQKSAIPETDEQLRRSEERFRLMVEAVIDYAIFMLDPQGHITSWNAGAQRLKGYRAEEIIGKHFSIFYTEVDRRRNHPQEEIIRAMAEGAFREEGWRVRKDGSQFWASVTITAVHDTDGRHIGFAKVTRDMTERRKAEQALVRMNETLQAHVRRQAATNQEVEAFSYSVSHDLRTPLRALDGFSKLLLERAAERLDDVDKDYLHRIRGAAQQMAQIIDAMLSLSRLSRTALEQREVDLSAMCRMILASIQQAEPERAVRWSVADDLTISADPRMMRAVMENLLRNAWKFTRKVAEAHIDVGATEQGGQRVYYVKDNGVGLDMGQAHRLFQPFQRLHRARDFEGTGLGLVTVNRILQRHNGRVWVESTPGQGTTFYFAVGATHAS